MPWTPGQVRTSAAGGTAPGGVATGTGAAATDPFAGWSDEAFSAGESVLDGLDQIESKVQVGVNFNDYSEMVADTVTQMQRLRRLVDPQDRQSGIFPILAEAIVAHQAAAAAWLKDINGEMSSESADIARQSAWALATPRVERARAAFGQRLRD